MRMLLQFQKGDIVRHLGLLDLQRTMQRALRRSGLPIGYSNGFNPHIVMTFASALSSGIPGDAEILDVTLAANAGDISEERCMNEMNRVLPPTLQVSRVRLVDDRFPKASAALEQAEYSIILHGGDAQKIVSCIAHFLAREEIMAVRKTKRSESLVNIRPMIHLLDAHYDEDTAKATLKARVSFVESATLKPDVLLGALCEFAEAELPVADIRRTQLLGIKNGIATPIIDM